MTHHIPCPKADLSRFVELMTQGTPFSFVRFSDGEIEILRNRYLEINQGKTIFRGREFGNQFPVYDSKRFDPQAHQSLRKDLLSSALFREKHFYKGVPASHNNAVNDREFLVRLNGGLSPNITFSDLFINSNYRRFRQDIVPLFARYPHIVVIANFRAKPIESLSAAQHVVIPDNLFAEYEAVVEDVMRQLSAVPKDALVLSSASSLSNIVAHKLFVERRDVTFLDIGTAVNDLLSLDHHTRAYHDQTSSWIKRLLYKTEKDANIRW